MTCNELGNVPYREGDGQTLLMFESCLMVSPTKWANDPANQGAMGHIDYSESAGKTLVKYFDGRL